jgi:RNA polymerase sigma-70 factor (ECF subfamily)
VERSAFLAEHRDLTERLHRRALASRAILDGRLSIDAFADALYRSAARRFEGETPSPSATARYLESLHVDDLALAQLCAHGDEDAWELFIKEFRPVLYSSARAMTRDAASARELADSIYADLYGLASSSRQSPDAGAERRSLLAYFHGRSRLSTWLRSVLAQRHVDTIRGQRRGPQRGSRAGVDRRLERLDAGDRDEAPASPPLADAAVEPDPDRPRYVALMQDALGSAFRGLEPQDRLRLCCYYVQGMTLAELGRLLGEHEATVSRKLDRIRRGLRAQLERSLAGEHRLTPAEIRLCYQYALEDPSFDLAAALRPS